MLAIPFAAAALAMAASGMSPMAVDSYQATKTMCRPFATSTIHSGPVCRGGGGGLLAAQPACFCRGPDVRFDEPACWPDGSPALFPQGRRPTARETDKLVSCIDYQRQQDKRR